jgi:hypothetical protein
MRIYVALLTFAACVASSFAQKRCEHCGLLFGWDGEGFQNHAATSKPIRNFRPPVRQQDRTSSRSWDEKGLLLTCIAPEIDKNADTDIFTDCALAPGRTLDDVMHSFVRRHSL